MASFTDNPQALGTFNPYVQQLPVEAMVKVGMQKQEQYNQGIQKIQTSIDNIAGLDIAKDADKAYLQSKVNELGNNLKFVAAGDFSDFQLVNSVNGMTGQLVKDPNVQNAVASTAKYRKEQAYGEQLKKDGKWSINREYDFNRSVSEWMDNDKVGSSFSGKYVAHTDVNKKALEIINKLHPNVDIYDIPNAVNKDGSPNYNTIASALHKRGITEVSSEQIRTAVNSQLDANDLDELASQGRYNYRGYSTETLQREATNSYETTRKAYESNLNKLERQLLVTNDPKQQESINESISQYKEYLGENDTDGLLYNNYLENLKYATENPDSARASLYKQNWLDNIANGFKYREVKDEIVENPEAVNFWKGKEYELNIVKEKNLQSYRKELLANQKRGLDISELNALTAAGKLKPPTTRQWTREGDATTQSLESLSNFQNYNLELQNKKTGILTDLSEKASSFLIKVQPADIKKNIDNYVIGKYKPKDKEELLAFKEYLKAERELTQNIIIRKKNEEEATNEVFRGLSAAEIKTYKNFNTLLKNRNNFKYKVGGKEYIYTPEDINNFVSKLGYNPGLSAATGFSKTDESLFTEKERALKYMLADTDNAETTSFGRQYVLDIYKLNKTYGDVGRKIQDRITLKTAEKMAPITGDFATESDYIYFKDDKERTDFANQIGNIVRGDVGKNVAGQNYEPEKALPLFSKDNIGNLNFAVKRKGDKYNVLITDKPTGKTQEISVTKDYLIKNPYIGQSYINQNTELDRLLQMNNGSTNGFKDFDHAYYTVGFFGDSGRNVVSGQNVTLPIAADLERSGNSVNGILKLKTGTGFITHTFPNVDPLQFEDWMSRQTNESLLQYFK